MPIHPDRLQAALARKLAPVYLIAGEEPLLVAEAAQQVREAARSQGFTERELLQVERSEASARLREAAGSGSLFAQRRIVELHLGEAAPDAQTGTTLVELAERGDPDLLVLVRCGALDARQRKSAWAQAVDRAGGFVYCWRLRAEELPRWAQARLHAAGLQADAEAVATLVARTEGNLLALAQDIDKLALLAEGRRIGESEVREAVADSAHADTFGWVARVMAGRPVEAARDLSRLLAQGESLPALLAALAWNLRIAASAAAAIAAGEPRAVVLRRLRVPRPREAALSSLLARHGTETLQAALARLARIDADAKRGREQQAREDLLGLTLALAGARLPFSPARINEA